jgi:hypothetical protein
MDTTPPGVSQQPIASTPNSESIFDSLYDQVVAESLPVSQQPAKAEPEPKAVAKEAPQATEDEGDEYESLDDFLAKNKLDPDAFTKLSATVKIDGESKRVPLADVLKSYQLEGHVNNKSIALSEQQKAWEAEKVQAQAQYKQSLDAAQNLGQYAYQQLQGEFASINWDQLKATDPIQWAIKSQEFQSRNAQIQAHLQQVDQAQQADRQRSEQERLSVLPKERERMLEARPEWREPDKFKEAQSAIRQAANKLGFTDQELNGIYDHRVILALDMVAKQAALQSAAPEALKKVRAAPIMAKPGTRTQRDPKAGKQQAAYEAMVKNPKSMQAQESYFDTLIED